MNDRTVIRLTFVAAGHQDTRPLENRFKWLLKHAFRALNLRCVKIEEVPAPAVDEPFITSPITEEP